MKGNNLSSLDAKIIHQKMRDGMVDTAKRWIKAKAKLVKEFPTLPSGEKGLVIGCGWSFPSPGIICRKILLPNGVIVWGDLRDYTIICDMEDDLYTSQTTLWQVETAVQKQSKIQKGG